MELTITEVKAVENIFGLSLLVFENLKKAVSIPYKSITLKKAT